MCDISECREYALRLCETCAHRTMCMIENMMNDLKENTPIDPYESDCSEHLDEKRIAPIEEEAECDCDNCPMSDHCSDLAQSLEDNIKPKDVDNFFIYNSIKKRLSLVRDSYREGWVPKSLVLSPSLYERLVEECKLNETIREGETLSQLTYPGIGTLPLAISESLGENDCGIHYHIVE